MPERTEGGVRPRQVPNGALQLPVERPARSEQIVIGCIRRIGRSCGKRIPDERRVDCRHLAVSVKAESRRSRDLHWTSASRTEYLPVPSGSGSPDTLRESGSVTSGQPASTWWNAY